MSYQTEYCTDTKISFKRTNSAEEKGVGINCPNMYLRAKKVYEQDFLWL